MALTSGTRFIGISPNVNLKERKSAVLNAETEPFTAQDIANFVGVGSQGPQGVQGPAGPIGPVGPAGLNWQGAWASGTSYVADDAVGYAGASWFCILATSGTTTPNLDTTHWALLASQGAQGIQGVQGPTGAQGPAGSSPVKTSGDISAQNTSFPTLTYDINTVYSSASGQRVLLPSGYALGREVIVYAANNGSSFEVRGATGGPGSAISLVGINSSITFLTVKSNENYKFTALESGYWKAESIGPSLQQTANVGNTITSSGGTITSLTGAFIRILNPISSTGISLGQSALGFIRDNGSGTNKTLNIVVPTNIIDNRTITLPDATGTVALQKYKETVILLSYDGTDFTYTNVINELGVTITFSVFSGILSCTLSSSVLTADKTIIWASSFVEFGGYLTQASRASNTSFTLQLTNTNGTNNTFPTSFYDLPIRIQVYN